MNNRNGEQHERDSYLKPRLNLQHTSSVKAKIPQAIQLTGKTPDDEPHSMLSYSHPLKKLLTNRSGS